MRNALAKLIKPHNEQEFFSKHWGADYLITKGDEGRFASMFSWDALSEILSTQRFDYPRLRLLVGGRVAPPSQYLKRKYDRRGNAYTTHDAEVVARLLHDGAMLHLTSVCETWEPLSTFAASLENDLHARVQVNLHAGFARSKGFHTHWDGHDVYAIQINGRKKWRLFGFTNQSPIAIPPDEKRNPPKRQVWEGILDEGDMLYIPRGYWHATQFLDDPSLHLTFAVQHPTGVDFCRWITDSLENEAGARRDIPTPLFAPGEGTEKRSAYVLEIRKLISNCLTEDSIDCFLREFGRSLGKSNRINLNAKKTTDERDKL